MNKLRAAVLIALLMIGCAGKFYKPEPVDKPKKATIPIDIYCQPGTYVTSITVTRKEMAYAYEYTCGKVKPDSIKLTMHE